MRHRAENRVQHGVKMFANVLGQETQHEIAVLLQKQVFPAVATIGFGAVEMLPAVQFNGESCLGTQQVHLHTAIAVKRNGKLGVEAKSTCGIRQCLQAAIEKSFGCAAGAVDPFGSYWTQFSGDSIIWAVHARLRLRIWSDTKGRVMAGFDDALRGYAFPVHQRDEFKCRYCGLDGAQSFANWLSLSRDHLLPKSHPDRDNLDYIVTACMFCNTADNRYFDQAEKRGLRFDGLTPDELVAQRLAYVEKTRRNYQDFWEKHVYPKA